MQEEHHHHQQQQQQQQHPVHTRQPPQSQPQQQKEEETTLLSSRQLEQQQPQQQQNKRKRKRKGPPVKRACVHCRKSHLSCSDTRPCTRCLQRGLVCFDTAPQGSSSTPSCSSISPSSPAKKQRTNVKVDYADQSVSTSIENSISNNSAVSGTNTTRDSSSSNINNGNHSLCKITSVKQQPPDDPPHQISTGDSSAVYSVASSESCTSSVPSQQLLLHHRQSGSSSPMGASISLTNFIPSSYLNLHQHMTEQCSTTPSPPSTVITGGASGVTSGHNIGNTGDNLLDFLFTENHSDLAVSPVTSSGNNNNNNNNNNNSRSMMSSTGGVCNIDEEKYRDRYHFPQLFSELGEMKQMIHKQQELIYKLLILKENKEESTTQNHSCLTNMPQSTLISNFNTNAPNSNIKLPRLAQISNSILSTISVAISVWDNDTRTLITCNESFKNLMAMNQFAKRKIVSIYDTMSHDGQTYLKPVLDALLQTKLVGGMQIPLIKRFKTNHPLIDCNNHRISVSSVMHFENGYFWVENVALSLTVYDNYFEIDDTVYPKTRDITSRQALFEKLLDIILKVEKIKNACIASGDQICSSSKSSGQSNTQTPTVTTSSSVPNNITTTTTTTSNTSNS